MGIFVFTPDRQNSGLQGDSPNYQDIQDFSSHDSKEAEISVAFPLVERPLLWRRHLPRMPVLQTVAQFRDTWSSLKQVSSCIARNHIKFFSNKCTLIKVCLKQTQSTTQSKLWVSLVFRYAVGTSFSYDCMTLSSQPATCLNSALMHVLCRVLQCINKNSGIPL